MTLKYLKPKIIFLTLIFILLLQSCSVYQKTSVTLDEASKSNTNVRIESNTEKPRNFEKIQNIDGKYVGIKTINGKIVTVPLDEKDIKSVRVLDKPKSDLATIGLIAGVVVVMIVGIVAATFTVF